MAILVESDVRVTIRQSDTAPSASEAATAWVSPDEATSAARPSKPAASGDRVMAEILECAGESPAACKVFRSNHGQYCGKTAQKMAKWRRQQVLLLNLGGNAGRIVELGAGPPVHGDEALCLFAPPQPCANRGECREVVIAAVGDMGVAVEGDIREGELARCEICMGLEVIFHHLQCGIAALHPIFQRVGLQVAATLDQRQP